ncbi:cytochrome P450 [Zychaea mexicana]|uniref:cytochrome P450 n=1 Tax=Zychaea mexicana TaxID=64656 RepID=UPI0022FEE38E|nr:cytochrome P450 [Zychaea mexicana]KAI9488450.1 cytochrome P450 [Zychaea mexicana]
MSQHQITFLTDLYKNGRLGQYFVAWVCDASDDLSSLLSRQGSSSSSNRNTRAVVAVAAVLVATIAWRQARKASKPSFSGIPTPKGCYPIFGHMFTIGLNRVEKFSQWHKELGPIFYIRTGVKHWLVIDDPYIAHEILVTKGKATADRQSGRKFHDFHSNGQTGIVLSSPDKAWSASRKAVLNALGPRTLKEASPVLCREADEFVDTVATGENIDPMPFLMRVSLNFILLTLFNVRSTSADDPLYKQCMHVMEGTKKFTSFKYSFHMLLPALKIVDTLFIGSQKYMYEFLEYDCKPFYLDLVEKALETEEDNMTKILNDEINQGKKGYYNNLLRTIHDMVFAGTDTTAVTMSWAFLQLSTLPDVQKRIQQEIDAFVAKNGRLPTFWERDQLPYMIATQRECLRFRPTTDFGVVHQASEDFEWQGNIIPKETLIITNMTTMHMNPDKYTEPESFKPERFLQNTETMYASANQRVANRDHFNFGWGRRVCVGAHLAETQMFHVWVCVFQKCDIKPALDENGNEIPHTLETVPPISGPTVAEPSPFEIRFVPRT